MINSDYSNLYTGRYNNTIAYLQAQITNKQYQNKCIVKFKANWISKVIRKINRVKDLYLKIDWRKNFKIQTNHWQTKPKIEEKSLSFIIDKSLLKKKTLKIK